MHFQYSILLPSILLSLTTAESPAAPPIAENPSNITTNTSGTTNASIPLNPASQPLDLDSLFEDLTEQVVEFNPWTREPECLTDPETDAQYCVYVSETAFSNRGISLFTSPALASLIGKLPAFTNPIPIVQPDVLPYEVRHVEGRGNGLFATRQIERGELILEDKPVGIYQSDAFPADYELGYKYLRKTFDGLPAETKGLFGRLGARHKDGDFVMERIDTNSFSGVFEKDDCFLVYPEAAMMNHDCRPNAMYHQDLYSLVHSTYASMTIQPGDEITISYINVLQSHDQRQEELQKIWGFECKCALCTATPRQKEGSEARVYKLKHLQTILTDWSPSSLATPKHAMMHLSFVERESLHASYGTANHLIALAYNGVKDVEKATEFAQKALKLGIFGTPDKGGDEVDLRLLLDAPEKHWSFGGRSEL